jgi:hypothetical protein
LHTAGVNIVCSDQVQEFVNGLFDMGRDLKAYKTHLRDFLIAVLVSDASMFNFALVC